MNKSNLCEMIKNAIHVAYSEIEPVLYETQCGVVTKHKQKFSFDHNKSILSMYDILIQDTGRFAELHASDVIAIVKDLEKALCNVTINSKPKLILFGIHKNGVDNYEDVVDYMINNFYSGRFFNCYRRIYAIEISVKDTYDLKCLNIQMKDMTTILPCVLSELNCEVAALDNL